VRKYLSYVAYRLLGAFTGPLPPRFGYWLARCMGSLLYHLDRRLRRVLAHNIGHVVGPEVDEEKLQALVREACVNIAKGHYDLFRLSRLTTSEIGALTRIEGQAHMEEALAQGKGVILITAHFGNVDVLAQLPLLHGVPFLGPVEHVQPEPLFQYTLRLRQSHGVRMIPHDGPLTELFRALKRGELIGLPCDRDLADNVREVEFFGRTARLPDGPVRLARRTGAALLPAFGLRLPDNTFLAQVEPALKLPHTDDKEADLEAAMKLMVEVLERHISRHPEQWLVAQPVWPMS
jgi:lauroyl/myristoyl acyltransferase